MQHSTLQRVLFLPFVILVLSLASVIYWSSVRSSESAGAEFSEKMLVNMVERTRHETERLLLGSRIALKAVAPDPVYSPTDGEISPIAFSNDFAKLEERMWTATGFFPEANHYVYFGGADGSFVGLNRLPDKIELRLQANHMAPRYIYSMAGPNRRLRVLRTDKYDAWSRPWYKSAVARRTEGWSEVYTDFTTLQPTFTLTKPVYEIDGSLIGVAATDVSLKQLTDFFGALSVSKNGVAFMVELSGKIIATSTDELPYRVQDKTQVRLPASQSVSQLVREAHAEVMRWRASGIALDKPVSRQFESTLGTTQIGATLLRDSAGLEWITIVAAPRSDFIGNIDSILYQSLAIGLVAVLIVLALGYSLLQWVLRDIRSLTLAAKSIGQGEPIEPLNIRRADEIGQLAKSFQEMERNLRTDKLTGILNRESLIAQMEFKMRNSTAALPLKFTLLFIDLDRFKHINDSYGHGAGDTILVEIAQRLKISVRADDQIARFGGDEFVVYLHGIEAGKHIKTVREKIRRMMESPIEIRGGIIDHVGASIGYASYPEDGRDIETLFRVADARMFEEKNARKENLAAQR